MSIPDVGGISSKLTCISPKCGWRSALARKTSPLDSDATPGGPQARRWISVEHGIHHPNLLSRTQCPYKPHIVPAVPRKGTVVRQFCDTSEIKGLRVS